MGRSSSCRPPGQARNPRMGEAAAAAAALHRRVEFHAATTRQPHAAGPAGGAGGFRADKRLAAAAAARSEGREKGEAGGSGGGFDRELAAARVYLRRIVSVSVHTSPTLIFWGICFFCDWDFAIRLSSPLELQSAGFLVHESNSAVRPCFSCSFMSCFLFGNDDSIFGVNPAKTLSNPLCFPSNFSSLSSPPFDFTWGISNSSLMRPKHTTRLSEVNLPRLRCPLVCVCNAGGRPAKSRQHVLPQLGAAVPHLYRALRGLPAEREAQVLLM